MTAIEQSGVQVISPTAIKIKLLRDENVAFDWDLGLTSSIPKSSIILFIRSYIHSSFITMHFFVVFWIKSVALCMLGKHLASEQ